MANFNGPIGIRPINDNGTPWSGQGRMVSFAANDANNIFLGDPIVPTGVVDSFGVPIVTIATAGDTHPVLGGFIGVCNGPQGSGFTLTQNLPVYRQASILNYGFVCDDPNQLYAVQEDSVGGAITAANAGFSNANLVAGSGNTTTGFSGWQLDSSTAGAGNAGYQLRIVGLLRGPDNALGNFAKWTVRINNNALWDTTGF